VQIINVAILENIQSIVDGYHYRLAHDKTFAIVAAAQYGEQLEALLTDHAVDVLLLEPYVPASPDNYNPFPVWSTLERVFEKQPALHVLVITKAGDPALIKQAVSNGVCGYILKEDAWTIRSLVEVVKTIAQGGVHFSRRAYEILLDRGRAEQTLSPRQLEALSLCAAYPDQTTHQLAAQMNIAPSTFRSLLSAAYKQLDTHTLRGAVEEARHRGWII
jgi:DNA-binding NarL/FixJ family response regulator